MNCFCSFPFPQNSFILNMSVFPKLAFFRVVTFCFSARPEGLLPWRCWAAQRHLPSPGSRGPGASLPVPPAEPSSRAMSNSCPGMCRNGQAYMTAFLQEGTVSYLCCYYLLGVNKCLLRARKSTRTNLPLHSHGYSWQACNHTVPALTMISFSLTLGV